MNILKNLTVRINVKVKSIQYSSLILKLCYIVLTIWVILLFGKMACAQDLPKKYCFDSTQIRQIAADKLELNYLQNEQKLWVIKDSIHIHVVQDFKEQKEIDNAIISSKDIQIRKLENEPKIIENKVNWTFWHAILGVAIAISSMYLGIQVSK